MLLSFERSRPQHACLLLLICSLHYHRKCHIGNSYFIFYFTKLGMLSGRTGLGKLICTPGPPTCFEFMTTHSKTWCYLTGRLKHNTLPFPYFLLNGWLEHTLNSPALTSFSCTTSSTTLNSDRQLTKM